MPPDPLPWRRTLTRAETDTATEAQLRAHAQARLANTVLGYLALCADAALLRDLLTVGQARLAELAAQDEATTKQAALWGAE